MKMNELRNDINKYPFRIKRNFALYCIFATDLCLTNRMIMKNERP